MPSVDLWLDWRPNVPVETLRALLPAIATSFGYRVDERHTLTTAPGWAMLDLRSPRFEQPVGSMRAQDSTDGSTQLFLSPSALRDPAALTELNRAALALYCGLLLRAVLPPPPPFELPDPPFLDA
jgi:hypothetical protein